MASSMSIKEKVRTQASRTRYQSGDPRPVSVNTPGLGGFIARQLGEQGSWRATLIGLASLAILARLILFLNFNQATLNLLAVIFMYAIVATGMAFLYSYGGLLSIAHGALWGVGAYAVGYAAQHHGWSFFPVAILAMVMCGLLAGGLAGLSIRVEGSYFIIILFAMAQVIYGVMENWTAVTGGTDGTVITVRASVFGIVIDSNIRWYWLTAITLIITLLVVQAAKTSRLGQRMKAIRDNRALATSVGINIVRTHMLAFMMTGAIAGVSGVFWGYFEGYIYPDSFNATTIFEFVIIILLGGAAYLLGPTCGAVVLIFLPRWLHLAPLLGDAMIGVVFIVVILASPSGIAGIFERFFHFVLSRFAGERLEDPDVLQSELATEAASEEIGRS